MDMEMSVDDHLRGEEQGYGGRKISNWFTDAILSPTKDWAASSRDKSE